MYANTYTTATVCVCKPGLIKETSNLFSYLYVLGLGQDSDGSFRSPQLLAFFKKKSFKIIAKKEEEQSTKIMTIKIHILLKKTKNT